MAKCQNKIPNNSGSDCGRQLLILVMAAILITGCQSSATSSSTVGNSASNTTSTARNPSIAETSENSAVAGEQTTLTIDQLFPPLQLMGDGILYHIPIAFAATRLDDNVAKNGKIVMLGGEFLSPSDRCVHQVDFSLIVGGRTYPADPALMNTFKSFLSNRDYPGSGMQGQCMKANKPERTFLVFDVPVEGTGPTLRFLSGKVYLGTWETLDQVLVALSSTSAPPRQAEPTPSSTSTPEQRAVTQTPIPLPTRVLPTATPTRTNTLVIPTVTRIATARAEDFTATGNANVRSCPQTTCDIVRGLTLGQRLTKVGEAQGETVNGSSLWYEIRLSNGSTGFVHSGLMRSGTPRPAPRVQNTAPAATSAGNTEPAATTVLPVIPQSTAAPPQWTCGGNFYNCSDFANRNDLMDYWNTCPGDPSHLDHDDDGIPCEYN